MLLAQHRYVMIQAMRKETKKEKPSNLSAQAPLHRTTMQSGYSSDKEALIELQQAYASLQQAYHRLEHERNLLCKAMRAYERGRGIRRS